MAEIKAMKLKEKLYDEGIFDEYKGYYSQIKENGVFGILHIKGNKIVGIRNRTNNPIFYLYPEFEDVKFKFNEGILVAEIVVFKNGKSVFYGGIDQRRSRKDDKENMVTAVVHDILKLEKQITINLPYSKRYELLSQNIGDEDRVRIFKNYDIRELWDKVIKENLEGMVLKNPKANYQLGIRSADYVKVKNYKETEVLIEDTEENEKGIKIFGTTTIGGETLKVDCQFQNGGVNIGETVKVRYLDIFNGRLIQPTKSNGKVIKNGE